MRLSTVAFVFGAVLFCGSAGAQAPIFDWTFSGDAVPASATPLLNAGQADAGCFNETDDTNSLEIELEISSSQARSKLDTRDWEVDASSCFSFAQWGAELGHDMVDRRQTLTSSDLSEYSLTFDAWVEGANSLNQGALRIQFLEEGGGDVLAELQNVSNPIGDALGLLTLTEESQTFTTTLDRLSFTDNFFTTEDFEEELGGIAGINFVFQAEGSSGEAQFDEEPIIGLDNNNEIRFDNIRLVAPFEESATLTLLNSVVNNHGGTAELEDFTLSATDGFTTIMGMQGDESVTEAAVAPGDFLLTSAGVDGYAFNLACTGAADTNLSDGLSIDAGEDVTCTFFHDDQPAKLTLQKNVVNNDGGSAPDSAWTMSAEGPENISGPAGSDAVTEAELPAGTYTISESGVAGYTATGVNCVGGSDSNLNNGLSLALGEEVVCTFTSNDIAPTITLQKQVVNDSGGTATDADFTLTAAGSASTVSGKEGEASITAATVPAGNYELSASSVEGYELVEATCTGGADTNASNGVDLGLAENIVCTLVSNDIAPRITLVKEVVNDDGGSAQPSDWSLTAAGSTTSAVGQSGTASVTNAEVAAGTYAISETAVDGYELTGISCVGGDDENPLNGLNLELAESIVCTLTSDDISPTITLIKEVINDNGGAAQAGAWTLSAEGSSESVSGSTGEAAITGAEVPAGTYALSESNVDGYRTTGFSCTGTSDPNPLNGLELALGEDIVCTLTSDDVGPSVTLVKQVINDNGGTATADDWTLSATGAETISGSSGDASVTAAEVSVGRYQISEIGADGYELTDLSCTGGSDANPLDGLDLQLADEIVCTLVSDDVAPTLTLRAVVNNDEGGTATATDWTLAAAGFSSVVGVSGSEEVTAVETSAGSFTLTQLDGPEEGYELASVSCVGAADLDIFDGLSLGLGENVVCTYTFDDVIDICDENSRGDATGDGMVDFADFLVLSDNFGAEVSSHEQGDFNCDGIVDFADFLNLSTFFGQDLSASESVPEPNGNALALLAVLGILGFRRRS